MKTTQYYEIVMSTYHKKPVGKLRFFNPKTEDMEDTVLLTVKEISEVICMWRQGELLGLFGIDTILASDATFIICED